MADYDAGREELIGREELKRRLKERTRETAARMEDPAFLAREKRRKADRARGLLTFAAIFMAFLLAAVMYLRNYTCTTWSLDRETGIRGLDRSVLEKAGKGEVLITRDAVFYLENGETVWTETIALEDPMVASRGTYFVLSDRGAYQFRVCDRTGVLSTVRLTRKIEGIDVSQSGVTACFTESEDASYVTYYDRYGSRIGVEVKTVLDRSGYPVDIAVSPDGQKLAAAYYSVRNGIGESRLVLYDFQNGSASKDYVVSVFEDFKATDTYLAECVFMDDTHLTAVGDNEILFLTLRKDDVKAVRAEAPENVRSVFFTEDLFGMVLETAGGTEVRTYDGSGKEKGVFEGPPDYGKLIAGDKTLLFLSGADVTLMNVSGRVRYEGTLVDPPLSAVLLRGRGILLNTGTALQKITVK